MTPIFLFLLIGFSALIIFGSAMMYRTFKKSKLVKCSFCEQVMDQNDFSLHAEQHIKSADTRAKIINFKAWLLKELEKDVPLDEETLIKQGSIVCGLSPNTIRPILRAILDHKSGYEDKTT